jgi:hypothetical protein
MAEHDKQKLADARSIYVKWPHGGWLLWNWDQCKWEHVNERG